MQRLILVALLGAAAFGTVSSAVAQDREDRDDDAIRAEAILASAKVTLPQAIATAEQVTGGTAVGVEIEDEDGSVFFEVQILKSNRRQKVFIDPQSGQVAKVELEDD
jgi:uncharacterized membrane protein YkoI